MKTRLSRATIHRGMRFTLVALFMGLGLLKVVIFVMPGMIAYFEALGSPGWLPALVVAIDLFLIMQIGLAMAGFYNAPADAPKEPGPQAPG